MLFFFPRATTSWRWSGEDAGRASGERRHRTLDCAGGATRRDDAHAYISFRRSLRLLGHKSLRALRVVNCEHGNAREGYIKMCASIPNIYNPIIYLNNDSLVRDVGVDFTRTPKPQR